MITDISIKQMENTKKIRVTSYDKEGGETYTYYDNYYDFPCHQKDTFEITMQKALGGAAVTIDLRPKDESPFVTDLFYNNLRQICTSLEKHAPKKYKLNIEATVMLEKAMDKTIKWRQSFSTDAVYVPKDDTFCFFLLEQAAELDDIIMKSLDFGVSGEFIWGKIERLALQCSALPAWY